MLENALPNLTKNRDHLFEQPFRLRTDFEHLSSLLLQTSQQSDSAPSEGQLTPGKNLLTTFPSFFLNVCDPITSAD